MGKDLSDDQISSMKEAFTLFNTDNDGKIAPWELGILIRSLGGNPTQAQLNSIVAEENLTSPFDFSISCPNTWNQGIRLKFSIKMLLDLFMWMSFVMLLDLFMWMSFVKFWRVLVRSLSLMNGLGKLMLGLKGRFVMKIWLQEWSPSEDWSCKCNCFLYFSGVSVFFNLWCYVLFKWINELTSCVCLWREGGGWWRRRLRNLSRASPSSFLFYFIFSFF